MDIDKLKALALAAGGDEWTDDADGSGYVFGADGDSVCVCHANAGGFPEFIYESDRAAFIAASCPATVLELIAEVERLRADAERFRHAIALEDNVEALYAAVLSNAHDAEGIRAAFDSGTASAPGNTAQPKEEP